MFKKILVGAHTPLKSTDAVLTAARIAEYNKAKLYILHVLESDSSLSKNDVIHFQTGEKIVADRAYEIEVEREMAKNYSTFLKSHREYDISVTAGIPWEEISRYSRDKNIDLIVLGPHHKNADENGLNKGKSKIGSTAEGVIQREKYPVMIVNRPMSNERVEFKKIMVAIDFSPSCRYALCFAGKLAQHYGSSLCLFHMLPVPTQPEYSQAMYESDLNRVKKRLEDMIKEIPGCQKKEYRAWGGVFAEQEILIFESQNDVDLIVMGSHTKMDGMKWYVGSVVEKVTQKAPCPVIVITDPEALKKWNG